MAGLRNVFESVFRRASERAPRAVQNPEEVLPVVAGVELLDAAYQLAKDGATRENLEAALSAISEAIALIRSSPDERGDRLSAVTAALEGALVARAADALKSVVADRTPPSALVKIAEAARALNELEALMKLGTGLGAPWAVYSVLDDSLMVLVGKGVSGKPGGLAGRALAVTSLANFSGSGDLKNLEDGVAAVAAEARSLGLDLVGKLPFAVRSAFHGAPAGFLRGMEAAVLEQAEGLAPGPLKELFARLSSAGVRLAISESLASRVVPNLVLIFATGSRLSKPVAAAAAALQLEAEALAERYLAGSSGTSKRGLGTPPAGIAAFVAGADISTPFGARDFNDSVQKQPFLADFFQRASMRAWKPVQDLIELRKTSGPLDEANELYLAARLRELSLQFLAAERKKLGLPPPEVAARGPLPTLTSGRWSLRA